MRAQVNLLLMTCMWVLSMVIVVLPTYAEQDNKNIYRIADTAKTDTYVHPRNKAIMQAYPREETLRYPSVPRVTPGEAFALYRAGKGLFVHIGMEGAIIPGCLDLKEDEAKRINTAKLAKIAAGRKIITYCN